MRNEGTKLKITALLLVKGDENTSKAITGHNKN